MFGSDFDLLLGELALELTNHCSKAGNPYSFVRCAVSNQCFMILSFMNLMHIKLHAMTPMTTLQTQTLSGNTDVIIITPCCSHCDQWSS